MWWEVGVTSFQLLWNQEGGQHPSSYCKIRRVGQLSSSYCEIRRLGPFPSPGDLPNPGIKPGSPTLQADALTSEPPEKPLKVTSYHLCHIMCHNWHLIMFTMFNGLEVSHRSSLPSRGENHTGVTGGCATELLSGKWGLEPCHTASLSPGTFFFQLPLLPHGIVLFHESQVMKIGNTLTLPSGSSSQYVMIKSFQFSLLSSM